MCEQMLIQEMHLAVLGRGSFPHWHSVQCFNLYIGADCIREGGISVCFGGTWWNIVVCDGLDTLPSLVLLKQVEIFF